MEHRSFDKEDKFEEDEEEEEEEEDYKPNIKIESAPPPINLFSPHL